MNDYLPSAPEFHPGNFPPKPSVPPDYELIPVVTNYHPPELDQIANIFEKAGSNLQERTYSFVNWRAGLVDVWNGKAEERYVEMTGDIYPMMEELYQLLLGRAKQLRDLQIRKYSWEMRKKASIR